MQQKGANALPPKQVMPAAAESSEEDSSEEEVSCKLDSVLYVRNYVSKTTWKVWFHSFYQLTIALWSKSEHHKKAFLTPVKNVQSYYCLRLLWLPRFSLPYLKV